MYYATITPEEASRGRGSSAEEQLHEAVNALLYSYYSGSSVLIYEEALRELIGPLWNLEIHPSLLPELIQRYAEAGWDVAEDGSNPHRRRWHFTPASVG